MVVGQRIPFIWVTIAIFFFHTCDEVKGHGHLWSPPQRSSMWRVGFSVPENYNDVGLNCGGFDNQWLTNHGRCGACGDPYQGPYLNDNGGAFDTGAIGATYKAGDRITVKIHLTAFHYGYFVFHLCEKGGLSGDLLQECFDKTTLPVVKNNQLKERYYPQKGKGVYTLTVQLPTGVSCRHCVLQWVYRVGNSWGSDKEGSGLGYGPQEHFINCADIKIRPSNKGHAHDHAPVHVDWYNRFLTDYNDVTLTPSTTTCTTTTTTSTTTTRPKNEVLHPNSPSIAKWITSNNRRLHQIINSRPQGTNRNNQVILANGAMLHNGFINRLIRRNSRQMAPQVEFSPIANDHFHIHQHHSPYKMLHQYRNLVPVSTPIPWQPQTVNIEQIYSNQYGTQQNFRNQAIRDDIDLHMPQPRQYHVPLPLGSPYWPLRNHNNNHAHTQRVPGRLGSYMVHQQQFNQPQRNNQGNSNRQGSYIMPQQQSTLPQQFTREISNRQGSYIFPQQQSTLPQQFTREISNRQGSYIIPQKQSTQPQQFTQEISNRQGRLIVQQLKQPQQYNEEVPNYRESYIIRQQNKQPQQIKTDRQGSDAVQQQQFQTKQYTEVPRTTPKPSIPNETRYQQTKDPRTTPSTVTSQSRGSKTTCEATGAWSGQVDMSNWCQSNCPLFCPSTHCKCR